MTKKYNQLTQVLQRYKIKALISSGKSTTYYLELTPWGQQKDIEEVSVSKALYNKLEQNDKVNIYYMKGQFDIPWFELKELKKQPH